MLTTGKTYDFEGEILSPMNWVKILANAAVTVPCPSGTGC